MNIQIVSRKGERTPLRIRNRNVRLLGRNCLFYRRRILIPTEQHRSTRRLLSNQPNREYEHAKETTHHPTAQTPQDPNPLRSFTGFLAAGCAGCRL